MRRFIDIVEQAGSDTYISAHLSGDIMWLDMMRVTPEKRGSGIGRKYYRQWELQLPKNVELVRLMAADTGSGLSNGFWEAMGYEYVYDGDPDVIGYEASQHMWKGVNGHPTPEPILVDPEDDY